MEYAYVVVSGHYDSYEVHEVFSSMERAEEYMAGEAFAEPPRVEVYEIDEYQSVRDRPKCWDVEIAEDGPYAELPKAAFVGHWKWPRFPANCAPHIARDTNRLHGSEGVVEAPVWRARVQAEDAQAAIDVAVEWVAEEKARLAGIG